VPRVDERVAELERPSPLVEAGTCAPEDGERRLAVIDLGSNSFRLVVFTWAPGSWWKRTDEIYEPVRIGAGLDSSGALQPEPMERALETIELYAHFCRATGVDDVRALATSAIREATNRDAFLRLARRRSRIPVEVLSWEAEARYGYLAAVNSTTLANGVTLDLGGGSLQLVNVADRHAQESGSWRLGAVRMTERFLPDERARPKQLTALRTHVETELGAAPWLTRRTGSQSRRRLVGIGGSVRNLAVAAQLAAGLPSYGVQGFELSLGALDELIARLATLPASRRRTVPGIKPDRGDLILAAAVVIKSVLEVGEFEAIEATQAGMREGVFFASLLADRDPPLFADVRRASVLNLAGQYHADLAHTHHVARLALEMWDALAEATVHPGRPDERGLLWAAAMLHDIGMTVDYDDHHRHSRYLIQSAGLPGFTQRETALVGQIVRYHRKGTPSLGEFEVLAEDGDGPLLDRTVAVLRVAEQLERARDQSVAAARVSVADGLIELHLEAAEDVTVARWSAERQSEIFERAFGRRLQVTA
jgi:exopolyphosphatase/guanosine-5'-triphosphate,3'-diphosphate pyrophosphatase